ncbi:MAG TPA: DUF4097 family beta strand repeat-containing protein [Pyrinomonadaceae bacterium]
MSVPKDETEKFEQSYPISANGRVSVSNINGSIEMVAWDRNEVRLEATKIADTREALGDVELDIRSTPDSFSVEVDYKDRNWKVDGRKYNKLEVQFRLSVPRTALLDEIETVNGSVNVSNFVNTTKVSAVNGSVTAANLRGNAKLSTVNGTVNADFEQLEAGVKVDLSTVNGRVNLSLPSDANATIKADSLNGGITNGFGLPVRKGEWIGRDLHGRLGNGDAQIKLDSVNGPLAINKKDDGRPTSPVTNLLSGAVGQTDRDREIRANAAKMRSEVRKATADAQRANREAVRAATRELENIKIPDLEKLKIDIDGAKIDVQIRENLKIQEKVLARMQDALFFADMPRVERKTNSFTVQGTPKVSVNAPNCSVRVRGWDKPEVKYVVTEYQDLRTGDEVKVTDSQSSSEINLTVSGGDENWMGSGPAPRLEVYVPRKSNLKISTKGEIRVEGVNGEIDLSGKENSIDVRGSGGKLTVSNTEGIVRVIDFKGDLIAKTQEGEVYLDGDFNMIEACSTEGRFVLTLPPGADADVHAPADQISVENLTGSKQADGHLRFGKGGRDYKFESTDGSVAIRNRESINSER